MQGIVAWDPKGVVIPLTVMLEFEALVSMAAKIILITPPAPWSQNYFQFGKKYLSP
jgi:hypothetical protein